MPGKTLSYTFYADGSRQTLISPAGNFNDAYDAVGRLTSLPNPCSETFTWIYLDNDWLWKQGCGARTYFLYDGELLTASATTTIAEAHRSRDSTSPRGSMGGRCACIGRVIGGPRCVLVVGWVTMLTAGCSPALHLTQPIPCVTAVAQTPFRLPRGERRTFLILGVRQTPGPYGAREDPPPFRGEVQFTREGRVVLRFPISDKLAHPSNWLEQEGFNGAYILNWDHERNPRYVLDDYLRSGQEYTLTVRFRGASPKKSSLWVMTQSDF